MTLGEFISIVSVSIGVHFGVAAFLFFSEGGLRSIERQILLLTASIKQLDGVDPEILEDLHDTLNNVNAKFLPVQSKAQKEATFATGICFAGGAIGIVYMIYCGVNSDRLLSDGAAIALSVLAFAAPLLAPMLVWSRSEKAIDSWRNDLKSLHTTVSSARIRSKKTTGTGPAQV